MELAGVFFLLVSQKTGKYDRRKGGENGETTAGEDGEIDEFGDRDESGGSLGCTGKYTHAIGEAQLLLQGHPCLRFPSRIFLTRYLTPHSKSSLINHYFFLSLFDVVF